MENIKSAPVQPKANSPLSSKAQDALHESVDTVAAKAANAERVIRDKAHRSAESISETQEKLQRQWNGSEVRRFAAENPVATVGIAFAAGMLITSILRKR